MLVLNASTFGTTHWTLITALGTTTPPSASPPSGCDFDAAAVSASPLLVWRAMPRDRRLPLWGVLCRCLTALQTTRRRASGSAHVLSHRLYPLQAMRLHILLSGWSAPPRFCKAGEGNELLCSRRCRWSASCARATATTSATCKAPGCGNLGILAARLREQARCGPHNTAVATNRDSTAAFIVFFFPSRLRLRSAMTQVTSVSDEDVLRWSRNLLDRRKVSDLDNFIQLRGITLPDLNDRVP